MPEGQAKRGSGRPWHLWVWRNFRIKLPDDWEMLQFSRKSPAGSCVFADRYQYRLEFTWKSIGARPDLKRLVSDYCAKLKLDGQMPDARPTEVGDWRGIVGHIGAGHIGVGHIGAGHIDAGHRDGRPGRTLTTRFGGYYSGESCLVELVFTWPEGRDRHLERAVLKSVKEEGVRRNGFRRWKAFGMDMLASGELEAGPCRVEPANVTMEFARPSPGTRRSRRPAVRTGAHGPTKERFQRVGMVSHWLGSGVGKWLERSVPPETADISRAQRAVSGHTIEAIRGFLPIKGMTRLSNLVRLTNRRELLEAAAWLCPADGRLYHCRTDRRITAPRGSREAGPGADQTALDLAGGRLSCCAGLGPAGARRDE